MERDTTHRFPQAGPSFDDPLGMLYACHDRIQRHCTLLQRVAHRVVEGTVDDEVREAAAQIVRYFSTAGRNHHADEEHDLFPRLRGHDAALDDTLAELETEHQEMEQLWEAVEAHLAHLEGIDDPHAFAELAARFEAVYQRHIARENDDVLPRGAELLDAEATRAVGEAMARRRGVK